MDAFEIIKLISQSKKRTPVRAFFKGNLGKYDFSSFVEVYQGVDFIEVFDELEAVSGFIRDKNEITLTRLEIDRRNSAIPLADLTKYNARIEPGAVIREMVEIGENCVIMMGAVINIGAIIGRNTMVDMNAVIGGRAIVGQNCHVGAGSVLAGVVEPPSANPVIVGDNVVVGANAVVLEGVKIGENCVVAAGSVVTKDVPAFSVVAGIPAKIVKQVDQKTISKTGLVQDLRKI